MDHHLLIQSTADGHLGSFQLWALLNVSMNVQVHVSAGCDLGVGLLGCRVFAQPEQTLPLRFPKWRNEFAFPPARCENSTAPHLFPFTHSGGSLAHVLEWRITELNVKQSTYWWYNLSDHFSPIIATLPEVFYKAQQSKIPKLLLKYRHL